MSVTEVVGELRFVGNSPYKFDGLLEISPEGRDVKKVVLEQEAKRIVVKLSIDADVEASKLIADVQLELIANRLCYIEGIPIGAIRVVSTSRISSDGNLVGVQVTEQIIMSDTVIVERVGGLDTKQQLKRNLEKQFTEEDHEYLYMYRQAVAEPSVVLQYLYLFRLLEKLCGQRLGADRYIRGQLPNAKKRLSGKNSDEEVTIFTWIRDNIHPKPNQLKFPYKESEEYLNILKNLVKQRLEKRVGKS